jgi:hypothetical protein
MYICVFWLALFSLNCRLNLFKHWDFESGRRPELIVPDFIKVSSVIAISNISRFGAAWLSMWVLGVGTVPHCTMAERLKEKVLTGPLPCENCSISTKKAFASSMLAHRHVLITFIDSESQLDCHIQGPTIYGNIEVTTSHGLRLDHSQWSWSQTRRVAPSKCFGPWK